MYAPPTPDEKCRRTIKGAPMFWRWRDKKWVPDLNPPRPSAGGHVVTPPADAGTPGGPPSHIQLPAASGQTPGGSVASGTSQLTDAQRSALCQTAQANAAHAINAALSGFQAAFNQ